MVGLPMEQVYFMRDIQVVLGKLVWFPSRSNNVMVLHEDKSRMYRFSEWHAMSRSCFVGVCHAGQRR